MKSRLLGLVLLSIVFVACASINAMAQNAGMSDVEVTIGPAEKSNFVPGEEMRYVPRATGVYAPSDSIALQITDFPMQRAAQKPADKSAEQKGKKDESILTFNFLYYIIQKYKLQDIID